MEMCPTQSDPVIYLFNKMYIEIYEEIQVIIHWPNGLK